MNDLGLRSNVTDRAFSIPFPRTSSCYIPITETLKKEMVEIPSTCRNCKRDKPDSVFNTRAFEGSIVLLISSSRTELYRRVRKSESELVAQASQFSLYRGNNFCRTDLVVVNNIELLHNYCYIPRYLVFCLKLLTPNMSEFHSSLINV